MKTILVLPFSALSAVALTACVTASFKEPVSDFTSSMSTATAAVGTYFTDLNDFERQIYLESALHDPTVKIGIVDEHGARTGLQPIFSPESIKARLDALALLTAYGEKLAALAGADAPERFNAGSAVLGSNLGDLANTFRRLSSAGDSTAAAYTGPIGAILGVFGQRVLERQRDRALRDAVQQAAPAVDAILNQLEADLTKVVSPLQETGTLQELQGTVAYYNANRNKLSYEQREALLAKVNTYAARYQAALSARPSEAIDGIRDAHAALVKYASSPRKPQDLAAFVSALDTFNNRLKPVVDNLQKLKDADNG